MADTGEVTIFDVALAAGVSIATVSRILNDKPDVSAATRQRVQQVIEQLGYTPHAQARRLAARRSRTIALHFPLERVPSMLELDFIVGAAAASGDENIFFNFITNPITEQSLLGLYRGAQVDGIILMEIHTRDWRVELLRAHGYPFAMIGHCADNTGLSFVDLDFEQSVVAIFDYLAGLGHRDIGFLGLPLEMCRQGYGPAVRCLAGYEQARQKYGLAPIYQEASIEVKAMFEATLRLLEEWPQLTAVAAVQGSPTVGVIRALRQAGRAVPDDVSVVGITAAKIAEIITPPLTVVNFPAYTMGYQAAKILISQLSGAPAENDQVLLPPELVVRKSTAAFRPGGPRGPHRQG